MDEQRIEQLAFDIYDEVYGHLDDKRHKSRFITEIIDWLINGDLEGRSLEDLVEEWREYTAEDEEDTMNESNWHRCVDCDTELGPAPGADGSGIQCGVTFCPGCGAMYRWDFWRLNRYRGDTGSIYEPRLERHGGAAHE